MAHKEGQDDGRLGDNWFTAFEDECLEDLENSESNMEETVQRDGDYALQKLFLQFQNSATAIAQMYKDRSNGLSFWIPFQNAASSVTTLYKESVDTAKHCVELGVHRGRQRHNKDIVSWLKKKRRHIRREDLLAFLCGKNAPQRTKMSSGMVRHSQSARLDRPFPRFPSADSIQTNTEPDLQCFREAIALQGLDGAMSNVSVDYRPHSNPSPAQISSLQRNNMEELNAFIIDECSRNSESRKRSATPDVNMDSPSRKKNRFF